MILLAVALACVDCHRDLVERYARTPMANTSGPVRAADEFAGKVGRQFTITPRLQLLWPGGRADLTFFIGSRRMGRSFGYLYKGHLYQAPVGYYANRRSWDLAPGYEHDSHPDLTRPITSECLFCHAHAGEFGARHAQSLPGDRRWGSVRAMSRRIDGPRKPCQSPEACRATPRFDLRAMPSLGRSPHRTTCQAGRRLSSRCRSFRIYRGFHGHRERRGGERTRRRARRQPVQTGFRGKALVWNVPQSPPTNRELRRDLPELPRCTAQFFRLHPVSHAKSKSL